MYGTTLQTLFLDPSPPRGAALKRGTSSSPHATIPLSAVSHTVCLFLLFPSHITRTRQTQRTLHPNPQAKTQATAQSNASPSKSRTIHVSQPRRSRNVSQSHSFTSPVFSNRTMDIHTHTVKTLVTTADQTRPTPFCYLPPFPSPLSLSFSLHSIGAKLFMHACTNLSLSHTHTPCIACATHTHTTQSNHPSAHVLGKSRFRPASAYRDQAASTKRLITFLLSRFNAYTAYARMPTYTPGSLVLVVWRV